MRLNSRNQRNTDQFAEYIQAFINDHSEVIIEYLDGHNTQSISGIITSINPKIQRIKCSHPGGVEWIPIEDILRIESANEK